MPNFTLPPDESARYETSGASFVVPAESPLPSRHAMRQALTAHDGMAQLEILLAIRTVDKTIEAWLVRVLAQNDSPESALEAARRLAQGTSIRSLRALQRAFDASRAAGAIRLAATCAASLWDRGERLPAHSLLSSQDTMPAFDLQSIEQRLGPRVPASWWSSSTVDRLSLAGDENSRRARLRILVRQGDVRAVVECNQALRGAVDERMRAMHILAAMPDRKRRAGVLRGLLRRESSPLILVEAAWVLGEDLPSRERVRVIRRLMRARNPFVRFAATGLTAPLPARTRKMIVKEWLARETDSKILGVLRDGTGERA